MANLAKPLTYITYCLEQADGEQRAFERLMHVLKRQGPICPLLSLPVRHVYLPHQKSADEGGER